MAIGQELGVPATAVPDLGWEWIEAARASLMAQGINRTKQAEEAERRARSRRNGLPRRLGPEE